jgi:transposase-like protein
MVERGGRAVVRVVADIKSATLLGLVREYVLPESTIYTDELRSYGGISAIRGKDKKPARYEHRGINHSSKVYVMGRCPYQHH